MKAEGIVRDGLMEWWLFFRDAVRGERPYLPSPTDIARRTVDLRWLQTCGFRRAFIVNVMELDNPSLERVRQMVARYGVEETYRRCEPFLEPTEYDGDLECPLP